MRVLLSIPLLAAALLSGSCQVAQPANAPPFSAVHADVTLHYQIPAAGPLGPRRGESCIYSYAGVWASGDAGIRAAAAAGAVSNIRAVDYSYYSWFWILFQRQCTVVYGD
ncbi:MAG: TRL-like family protein [Leptospirales bacterium]|nr:TRL-like family protein [Leptospirales bacterium]